MSLEWESLPLLPLRCILDHLSVKEALAATSTCRHWRQAMLLYEGRRDTLTLRVKQLEQSLYLTRLFRKHVKKLHIYINCGEDELAKFMNFVLPQFFDSIEIKEVLFIGPIYIQQNPLVPFSKLKRIITESFVYKHANLIHKFAIMGCEMAAVNNDKDRFVHKHVEHYSKPLSFSCVTTSADIILSKCNVEAMKFSTLKHIIFEYELVTQKTLDTLSALKNLKQISMNLINRRGMNFPVVNWNRATSMFSNGIDVAINIINLPEKKFKAACQNVFVIGMPLTSLKIMFCKSIYTSLISHVCCLYNSTLRELVWVDPPYVGPECARVVRTDVSVMMSEVYNQVNPFILLCWQCENLRRLVIHGYWIWQYDLLGFARLRKNLKMEISSLYPNQGQFNSCSQVNDSVMRVMNYDRPSTVDSNYKKDVNTFSDHKWEPFPWRNLPSGLRANSSSESRATYIVTEVLQPWGIT